MSYCLYYERSLFSFEEFEPILRTHHPFVEEIDEEELLALRPVLRAMRDKESTHARQRRREARGKGRARGGSVPGAHEQPARRKQVVASALRRLNAEITRRRKIDALAANREAARRALAMRSEATFRRHPSAEAFSKSDRMRSLPSRKRRPVVLGSRIGRVSQANKVAQAARDRRA
jgi:hypothetical protein